jgi:hypothetical protein
MNMAACLAARGIQWDGITRGKKKKKESNQP